MNKTLIVILVLLLVVFGGYFLLKGGDVQAPAEENTELSETTNTEDATPAEEMENVNMVNYTNDGYSPSTLTIKKGETVTWKNNSTDGMWTASSMHPSHKDYPTTGGCLGSTFDSCASTQPGESWSFQFDIAGEWSYHNHVVNGKYGKVIVVE